MSLTSLLLVAAAMLGVATEDIPDMRTYFFRLESYTSLITQQAAALQTLLADIDFLKAENSALKNRTTSLESAIVNGE